MTAIMISNNVPWGQMTNQSVGRIVSLNNMIVRLNEAVATASSNYSGVPGTQFETSTFGGPPTTANNFGVQADPNNPGQKGTDYAYAVSMLASQWTTFWNAAVPYIQQLDNGVPTM